MPQQGGMPQKQFFLGRNPCGMTSRDSFDFFCLVCFCFVFAFFCLFLFLFVFGCWLLLCLCFKKCNMFVVLIVAVCVGSCVCECDCSLCGAFFFLGLFVACRCQLRVASWSEPVWEDGFPGCAMWMDCGEPLTPLRECLFFALFWVCHRLCCRTKVMMWNILAGGFVGKRLHSFSLRTSGLGWGAIKVFYPAPRKRKVKKTEDKAAAAPTAADAHAAPAPAHH